MALPNVLDTALDRSLVLGYTHVGIHVRRRLPGWPADPPRMDGRIVLVTGAASGIGLAAAIGFARLGATVHVLARNALRAADAVRDVRAEVPEADVVPEACDLASLDSLRRFTAEFRDRVASLDVLVNNAGVMPGEREHTADGVELTFATNVLAPWVLTHELRDLLAAASPGRVVNVSSGGMYGQALPAGDLQSEQTSYGPKKIYARTKRAEVVLTELWAQRLRDAGVVVHAMHPGWVDTKGVRTWMPVFRFLTRPLIRNEAQGADTIVWLGGSPEALESTGGFWHDRRRRPTHYALGAGEDAPETRQELWDLCERLSAGG